MNSLAEFFQQPSFHRIGWVIVHFLWQGAGIGLLLALLLRILDRASSHLRYLLICAALFACGVAPAITWVALAGKTAPSLSTLHQPVDNFAPPFAGTEISGAHVSGIQNPPSAERITAVTVEAKTATPWRVRVPQMLDPLLPYAVFFWLAGVLALTLRLALGWMQLQRIRRSGKAIPDAAWQEKLLHLAQRMRVNAPVRLLKSALVEVPTLIGWLRPVILLPASVFASLTAAQLEAILAHELAHVRRYDYLVNLFQTAIETILFYHPAVWWISRKLREERENCCDDIAVETTRDRAIYASALAALEERLAFPPPLAMAASGGTLLGRIRRIAGVDRGKSSLAPIVATLLIVGILLAPLARGTASGEDSKAVSDKSAMEQQLADAVHKGDAPALQKLLGSGLDPNKILHKDEPLLFFAESPEVAEILIKHGADPNIKDKGGYPVLASFCGSKDKNAAAIVRVLLKAGADPNVRYGPMNETPLMQAASPDIVDALVEYGADMYAKTSGGLSVLVMNGRERRLDVFQAIIKHGVPFNPKTDGASILVSVAWINGLDMAQWLLAHGVDPNTPGNGLMDINRNHKLQLPIESAAVSGNPQMITLLLEHGAKGDKPMVFALHNNHAAVVKVFWDHGVRGISELAYAVSQGAKLEELQKILDKGSAVDPPQDTIITPLGAAAGLGRMDLVKFLVEHGADVNKGSATNPEYPQFVQTPLARAAGEGRDEIVEYLLKHGAKVNFSAMNEALYNSVPYEYQAAPEHFQRVLKLLIGAGGLKGATPEQAGYYLSAAIGPRSGKMGNASVLKMLLDAGLSPESPMPYLDKAHPNTVIGYLRDAWKKDKESKISYEVERADALQPLLDLLEADAGKAPQSAGAQESGVKPALNDALFAAAKKGDDAAAERLLQQGADPNDTGSDPMENALFAAARENHADIVRLFLKHGANPNCENACGNKLIDWVLYQGHLEMGGILRDAGAKISPEGWAAATGDIPALKSLAQKGVFKKGTDGAMPYAVAMGQFDAVKFLEGVDGKPVAGKFLRKAAMSGNIKMMEYLLSRGADLKTDGADAMDFAVIFFDQPESVKFLLAHGVDPNRLNPWSGHDLDSARSAAVVKILLNAGANPDAEGMFGPPLATAPDAESVRLLVQHGANLKPKLKNGETLVEKAIYPGHAVNTDVIRAFP